MHILNPVYYLSAEKFPNLYLQVSLTTISDSSVQMSFPTPLPGCPDNLKVDMSKTELVISYKPVPFITFPISSVGNPIPASAQ